jgi:hypothetical protein
MHTNFLVIIRRAMSEDTFFPGDLDEPALINQTSEN